MLAISLIVSSAQYIMSCCQLIESDVYHNQDISTLDSQKKKKRYVNILISFNTFLAKLDNIFINSLLLLSFPYQFFIIIIIMIFSGKYFLKYLVLIRLISLDYFEDLFL